MAVDVITRSAAPCLIVSRKLQGYDTKSDTDVWADSSAAGRERISALKNKVSKKASGGEGNAPLTHLPFINNVGEGGANAVEAWFNSKEGTLYERQLATKLVESLKLLMRIPIANPLQASFSLENNALEMAEREHQTHARYLEDVGPSSWIAREPIDTKLNE